MHFVPLVSFAPSIVGVRSVLFTFVNPKNQWFKGLTSKVAPNFRSYGKALGFILMSRQEMKGIGDPVVMTALPAEKNLVDAMEATCVQSNMFKLNFASTLVSKIEASCPYRNVPSW
jgi:hypothetical protein